MFGWISDWWKQKQHKSGRISNRNEPNDDAYEHPSAVIRTDHADTAEAEYREHDRQYKDRQISTNRLIALFTAVTAAVGIWQGVLTRQALRTAQENNATATLQIWRAIDNMNWMARSMNGSLTKVSEQATDTRVLATAAKSQADNTKTLAEQTKIALHVTERAHIMAAVPDLFSNTHTEEMV